MHVERHAVSIITDGSGNVTAFTPVVNGRVLAIHYVKPGAGGFDNGVDFTITAEATGENLWTEQDVNASKSVYPRAQVHSLAGVAAVLDGDSTPMRDAIVIANDRVKIAVASGGNAKAGTFHVVIG